MSRVRVGQAIAVQAPLGVDLDQLQASGWEGVFGRPGLLVVEIGFGNGQALEHMATERPQVNFVGIELYGKGIKSLSRRLERRGIGNVRILKAEALQALCLLFPRGEIAEVHVNFPDPWPKMRHHKRRLVGPHFPPVLFSRMAPGGKVFMATDHDCYAYQMRTVFEAHPGFVNEAGPHRFIYHRRGRLRTKYEKKFAARGARIRFLTYHRRAWA